MKKIVSKCLLVGLGWCAALAGAAEANLVVKVPFSFIAGSTVLPAGDYAISQDERGAYVQITNVQTRMSVITVPEARVSADGKDRSAVQFIRVGGQYHIKVVRIAGTPGFLMHTSAPR
jgi:hypothetical protein